jgi:3-phosphoglycerate kinase
MSFKKAPFVFILGGDVTYDKILLYYTLLFYVDTLILTGHFGL